MKPVLMIHEVREEMFKLPLDQYTLTFDDGLYSQFYYYPAFAEIPTEKIYFISSNIICSGHQSSGFPACRDAHVKARAGNFEDYMTVEQIKELMADPLVEIGGHSHNHVRLDKKMPLVEKVTHLRADTELMVDWFGDVLSYMPTSFCFPYNDPVQVLYPALLKQYGFTKFYGKERIAIETLL